MSSYFGQSALIELPPGTAWDPRTGVRITRRFRGHKIVVASAAKEARRKGLRYTAEDLEDGQTAVLAIDYGAEETQAVDEPLADQWELVGNDAERSLWVHPRVVAQVKAWLKYTGDTGEEYAADGDREGLARWRGWVDAFAGGAVTAQDEEEKEVRLTSALLVKAAVEHGCDEAEIKRFLDVRVAGEDSFVVSQFVLRRTLTVAGNTSLRPDLGNIGRIYGSTGALVGSLNAAPVFLLDRLPEGQWLKRTPTVSQAAADKWQIAQEWWHADTWARFAYPLAT